MWLQQLLVVALAGAAVVIAAAVVVVAVVADFYHYCNSSSSCIVVVAEVVAARTPVPTLFSTTTWFLVCHFRVMLFASIYFQFGNHVLAHWHDLHSAHYGRGGTVHR
jgi:hypothetical protein